MTQSLRPLQAGDYITTGTKLYLNFPDNYYEETPFPSMDGGAIFFLISQAGLENTISWTVPLEGFRPGQTTSYSPLNIYISGDCISQTDLYKSSTSLGLQVNLKEYTVQLESNADSNLLVKNDEDWYADTGELWYGEDYVGTEWRSTYFLVDPTTLAKGYTGGMIGEGGSSTQSFGTITKNGIAYNLIYKNGVQYTMIYLGGNRWWSYGTPPKTVYKRRIMVGDPIDSTIYISLPQDETVIKERYQEIAQTMLENGSGSTEMVPLFYAGATPILYTIFSLEEDDLIGKFAGMDGCSFILENSNDFQYTILVFENDALPREQLEQELGMPLEFFENGVGIVNSSFQMKNSDLLNSGLTTFSACNQELPNYRYYYIKDPNIRPLEVGDYLMAETPIYVVIPDDFYKNWLGEESEEIVEGSVNFGEIITSLSWRQKFYLNYSYNENYVSYGGQDWDIYWYNALENTLDNYSLTSIIDLADYGGMGWPNAGYVRSIDKNDPYYKYLLVDETKLGTQVLKLEFSNTDATGASNEFSVAIQESDLLSHDWILKRDDGYTEIGLWEKSSEPGPYTGGAFYSWSGDKTSIALEITSASYAMLTITAFPSDYIEGNAFTYQFYRVEEEVSHETGSN